MVWRGLLWSGIVQIAAPVETTGPKKRGPKLHFDEELVGPVACRTILGGRCRSAAQTRRSLDGSGPFPRQLI
jgi:hypothetical protein